MQDTTPPVDPDLPSFDKLLVQSIAVLFQWTVTLGERYGVQFLLTAIVAWYMKRLARKWLVGYYAGKLQIASKPWFYYGLLDTCALFAGIFAGFAAPGLPSAEGVWVGVAGGALMGTVASLAQAALNKLRRRAGITTSDIESTSGDITLEPFAAITPVAVDPAEKPTDRPAPGDLS